MAGFNLPSMEQIQTTKCSPRIHSGVSSEVGTNGELC